MKLFLFNNALLAVGALMKRGPGDELSARKRVPVVLVMKVNVEA